MVSVSSAQSNRVGIFRETGVGAPTWFFEVGEVPVRATKSAVSRSILRSLIPRERLHGKRRPSILFQGSLN